ncbi:O-antigen ligase [Nitrincola lacisaponensis]|uniref:O-antigen ligase n=1 Tax=Nitrincola lacisaponensis TaxID=267850 RepID=A0A063Y4N8_9GAMM|nr:O-antigen ligase family protein [Nitrincola lacisaponensis]KDE40105.1 O-antigen ligase [Nitrincola lacisaponensis]
MRSQVLPWGLKGSGFFLMVFLLSFSIFFAVEKAYKILPVIYFIAAVFYVLKEKPFLYLKIILFYFFAVSFVIFGDIFNIFFGNSDFSGIEQVARNLILVFPLVFLLNNEKISERSIVFSVFLMLCVTAIASILQFYSVYAQESSHFNGQRIGLWWNPVPFANSIVIFLGLLLGAALIAPKSYWNNIIVGLACLIMFVVIYLSGTRSALLSYFVVVFIYLLAIALDDKRVLFRSWMAVALFALVIATAFLFGDRVALAVEQLYRHFDEGPEYTSVSIRLSSWYYSWLIFLDNPLFGYGTRGASAVGKSFVDAGVVPEYVVNYHAHSDIFDAMKRNGLLGIFGLLWVYLSPFIMMWYFKISLRDMAPVLLVIVAFFISGLTEINIRHNVSANSFYMAYMLALAVVFRPKVQGGKVL